MSSLLQFGGAVRGGKVGLLFYRVQFVRVPPHCTSCGGPWNGEVFCVTCRKFVEYYYGHAKTADEANQYEDYREMYSDIWEKARFGPRTSATSRWTTQDVEPIRLSRRDGSLMTVPKLYRVWRKPKGMLGHFVTFQWNGKLHAPDLSVPIAEFVLPKDATELPEEQAAAYWQS